MINILQLGFNLKCSRGERQSDGHSNIQEDEKNSVTDMKIINGFIASWQLPDVNCCQNLIWVKNILIKQELVART